MNVGHGAKGDGTVERLPSGRYRARVDLGRHPVTGKRMRRSVTADTKSECRRLARQLISEAESGTAARPGTGITTIATMTPLYRTHIQSRLAAGEIRPKTAEVQDYYLTLIAPLSGLRLSDVTPTTIEAWQAGMSERSRSSRRGAWLTLRRMFKLARREGLTSADPFRDLTAPSGDREKEPVPATADDVAALLAASTGRWRVMFAVLAYTGMRSGEVLALEWRDYDGETLRVREGKTERSRRAIPVAPPLKEILNDWPRGTGLMFPTANGTQVRHRNFLRAFQATQPRENLTPHSFRHGLVTNLLAAGVPVQVVSAIVGHVRAGFTLSHYAHSATDAERGAMHKLWVAS